MGSPLNSQCFDPVVLAKCPRGILQVRRAHKTPPAGVSQAPSLPISPGSDETDSNDFEREVAGLQRLAPTNDQRQDFPSL